MRPVSTAGAPLTIEQGRLGAAYPLLVAQARLYVLVDPQCAVKTLKPGPALRRLFSPRYPPIQGHQKLAWYLSNPTTTQCRSIAYISAAVVRFFISSIVVACTASTANLSKTGSQTCMASEVEPHFAPWSTATKGGVLLDGASEYPGEIVLAGADAVNQLGP